MSAAQLSADGHSFFEDRQKPRGSVVFGGCGHWHGVCHISPESRFLIRWRAAMNLNHETLMLRSLFGACVLICTMTLGSMLLV
jgi:hypothetical protein